MGGQAGQVGQIGRIGQIGCWGGEDPRRISGGVCAGIASVGCEGDASDLADFDFTGLLVRSGANGAIIMIQAPVTHENGGFVRVGGVDAAGRPYVNEDLVALSPVEEIIAECDAVSGASVA